MPDPDDQQTDYLAPTPLPGDPPRYHISEQALDSIAPIADKLGEWIPEGMTVLFVSPEDVKDAGGPQAYYESLPDEMKESIPGEYILKEAREADNLTADDPYPHMIQDFDNWAIIVMANLQTQKEDMYKLYHLSVSDLENIVGTDAEVRALMCAHEIAHMYYVDVPYTGQYRLAHEIYADQKMCAWFKDINPEAAECYMAFRAIDSIMKNLFSKEYILSSNMIRNTVQDDTHMTAGSVKGGDNDIMMIAETAEDIYEQNWRAMEAVQTEMAREISKLIYLKEGLDAESAEYIDASRWKEILRYQTFNSKDMPLVFQAAVNIYERGIVDDDPQVAKLGNQILWEFVEGVRKYAPTRFGVDNPDQPFPAPPYQGPTSPLPTAPFIPAAPGGGGM